MKRIAAPLLLVALGLPAGLSAQKSVDEALGREQVETRDTPGLPDHLAAIDAALPGGLMNDPTDLNWAHYGDRFGRELVVDESYPGGGAALRVTMGESGPTWAGGINIPLLAKVERGEIITIGFFARTVESAAGDGLGKVAVRFQQDREPYPGFGDKVLDIGKGWGWYEVTAVADRDIKRNAIVAMQFGLARQTLEIGQAIVVTGTRSIGG